MWATRVKIHVTHIFGNLEIRPTIRLCIELDGMYIYIHVTDIVLKRFIYCLHVLFNYICENRIFSALKIIIYIKVCLPKEANIYSTHHVYLHRPNQARIRGPCPPPIYSTHHVYLHRPNQARIRGPCPPPISVKTHRKQKIKIGQPRSKIQAKTYPKTN